MEAEFLAELERKKKEEEAKLEEEMKKNPALAKALAKAPQKPPAKGAKEEKPVIDVPKIPVPQVTEYKSEMGNQYLRER